MCTLHRVVVRLAAAWLILASPVPAAWAAADAVVVGAVVDPLGGLVAGAELTLVRDGAPVATTTADAQGAFSFEALTEGRYRLAVRASGFAPRETDLFFVAPGARTVMNVSLQIGPLRQDVVVSAAAAALPRSQVGAAVSVIGPESLEVAGRLDVSDALRTVAGAQVFQTGARGGQASLFMRGGESDFVRVLIDGVPVNDIGGAIDFADIQTTGVERVEVMRGTNSVLYGVDALSGVVNLTTARGVSGQPEVTYAVTGGSFGTFRQTGSIGGGHSRFDYFATYSRLDTDNELANNAFRNDTIAARVGAVLGAASDLSVTLRRSVSEFGLPNAVSYFGIPDDSSQTTHLTTVGATVRSQMTPRLLTTVRASVSDRSLDLTNPTPTGEPYDPFGFGPNYLGDVVTIRGANDTMTTGQAVLDYGGVYPSDYHAGSVRRSVSGQADYQVRPAFSLSGGVRYDYEDGFSDAGTRTRSTRHNVGGFVETRANVRRLFVNAGVGFDHNEVFGSAFVPRVSLALYLREPSPTATWGEVKWTFNAGRGIKAPDISQELSSLYEIVDTGSEPALPVSPIGPERSTSVDVGIEQALFGGAVRLQANVFASRFRDLIEFVNDRTLPSLGIPEDVAAATAFGAYVNASSYDAHGLETSVEAAIGPQVRLTASYVRLHAEVVQSFSSSALAPSINPAYPDTPVGAYSPLIGARPFRRPANSGSLTVTYAAGRTRATVSGFFSGKYDDSTYLSDASFGSSMLLPNRDLGAGYRRIDAGASYAITPRVQALLSIDNLLNASYEAAPGFPSLDRAIRAGMQLTLGGDGP